MANAREDFGKVDLGFVVEETTEPWRLLSHFFPSKVGGKPAWLGLKPLPSENELRCGVCQKPCAFLLQAYAPVDDQPTCFHRTLFVFICRNPDCCQPNENNNLVVLRSQLARRNEFYAYDPPADDKFDRAIEYPRADRLQTLCVVCGCAASKKCGKCQRVSYCSKDHQTLDWTAGAHKTHCGNNQADNADGSSSTATAVDVGFLFKEFELDYEKEEGEEGVERRVGDQEEGKSEEERLGEYKQFLESSEGTVAKDSGLSAAELDRMTTGMDELEDKQFMIFKDRIRRDPEQVIRYERSGEPLWITDETLPTSDDIPPCMHCGAPRIFEFQVLPQLLLYLDVDSTPDVNSIDWGVLVIYTCSRSCEEGGKYGKEFVWKQDFKQKKK